MDEIIWPKNDIPKLGSENQDLYEAYSDGWNTCLKACKGAYEKRRPFAPSLPTVDDVYSCLCDNRITQDDDGIVKMRFKEYNDYLWNLAQVVHALLTNPAGGK